MLDSIKSILMQRDGVSPGEADAMIEEARRAFNGYMQEGDLESAENICEEFFGLEPDYLVELM